jgi:hypothetical protein
LVTELSGPLIPVVPHGTYEQTQVCVVLLISSINKEQ